MISKISKCCKYLLAYLKVIVKVSSSKFKFINADSLDPLLNSKAHVDTQDFRKFLKLILSIMLMIVFLFLLR